MNPPPNDTPREDIAAWEDRVRALAREVCAEMMSLRTVHHRPEDAPPEPTTIRGEGRGRRQTRRYERVTVTMDKNLYDLFKADLAKRQISAGRMMDTILWNWYGKPRLSYGEEPSTDE